MTTIAEMTEACRKLRLRKQSVQFRPRLTYLVEAAGAYVHPSRIGYHAGQTAWADAGLWFQCHSDAKAFADTRPTHEHAKVIKLNVCAFREDIRQRSSGSDQ